MQKWTRWQVWVALLAGAYAALSPIWTETDNTATWTMVVLGVVTAAVSLWSLAMAEDRFSEYALVLVGALFIASPWVMGFDHIDNMALTAWIVGAVTAIAGVLGMPDVEQRMHLRHRPIAH
jgi:peptidoglycan/LPS O-acetylase OafA/YrhL